MRRTEKTDKRKPVERLQPDPAAGITFAQAAQRTARGWDNRAAAPLSKTTWQIVRDNVFTPFNLLFCVLAACLFAVGSYSNMMFLGIVVCNTLIGIIQELRVKRELSKITLMAAPTAQVVREGQELRLPVEELVLDDVVRLAASCQIPADAVLLQGALEVNEALLTGEADNVAKAPGDRLLSGSFVVSGRGAARLDAVGADAFAARITHEAKRTKKNRSEMMRSLDKLLRWIGLALIPVAVILFVKQYTLLHTGLEYAVTSTVGAVVGMIPEGLYLLTSLALAVGVLNLARRRTLVHELSCIENLARVDVLCLDKTGTLTEGSMEVLKALPLAQGLDGPGLEALLGSFVHSGSDDNATARALKERFSDGGLLAGAEEIAFSSARKWSARRAGDRCLLLGAPEVLLGARRGELDELLAGPLSRGERALLLAQTDALPQGDAAPQALRPLGLVLLSDKIRPEAPATLAYFREQGVSVKIISGDNPASVAAIAGRAGVPGAERYVDLSLFTRDEEVAAAAEQYTVFGRVTPEQKRVLVRAMKAAGHTVAMTGDGVNDVLALKDADCSVAMASGSEAAQQVSQLVLLDSDFSAMPAIVNEGRRVINNIQRSAALFLVKNILSLTLSLVLVFVAMPYPFVPLQLTLLSALTIGVPSFLLTLEPCYNKVKGKFMQGVLLRALPGGLTDVLCILGVMGASCLFHLPQAQVSTICTLLAGYIGMLVLYHVCKPFNRWRRAMWVALFAAFFVCSIVGARLLGLVWLNWVSLGIFAFFAVLAPFLLLGLMKLAGIVQHRLRRGGQARRAG